MLSIWKDMKEDEKGQGEEAAVKYVCLLQYAIGITQFCPSYKGEFSFSLTYFIVSGNDDLVFNIS